VCSHTFVCGAYSATPTKLCKVLVGLMLVLAIALLLVGVRAQSFIFEYEGVAGLVLPPDSFSLWSVGLAVSGGGQSDFGIKFIQVAFLLFAMVMPIAQLAVLCVLWCCPVSIQTQRKLFITSEVFGAWSALDVFIVSIITALLELSQFATFIVDSFSAAVMLDQLVADYCKDLLPSGQVTLVQIVTELNSGCWLLFGAALIAMVLGQVVTRCAETSVHDRERQVFGMVDHSDHLLMSGPSRLLRMMAASKLVVLDQYKALGTIEI